MKQPRRLLNSKIKIAWRVSFFSEWIEFFEPRELLVKKSITNRTRPFCLVSPNSCMTDWGTSKHSLLFFFTVTAFLSPFFSNKENILFPFAPSPQFDPLLPCPPPSSHRSAVCASALPSSQALAFTLCSSVASCPTSRASMVRSSGARRSVAVASDVSVTMGPDGWLAGLAAEPLSAWAVSSCVPTICRASRILWEIVFAGSILLWVLNRYKYSVQSKLGGFRSQELYVWENSMNQKTIRYASYLKYKEGFNPHYHFAPFGFVQLLAVVVCHQEEYIYHVILKCHMLVEFSCSVTVPFFWYYTMSYM